MENTFQDVHKYDNTWGKNYMPSCNWKESDKEALFLNLITRLTSVDAIKMVQLIMKGGVENYDVSNNANASDILADICTIPLEKKEISLLEEQLEDNFKLGQCPQGRTTRLFQLYLAFVSSK